MKRNYISPEFNYSKTSGSMNMKESTSFFGSKMLAIDNTIKINNDNIVYYENNNGEQINLQLEKNNSSIVYNIINDKLKYHSITLDENTKNSTNPTWIIKIDIKSLLQNYLFATLKHWRTFEGLKNSLTLNNSVNKSLLNYISENVYSRYKFNSIDFYIKNNHYSESETLKFSNSFKELSDSNLKTNKISLNIDSSDNLIVLYKQETSVNEYNFTYYFNVFYEKV